MSKSAATPAEGNKRWHAEGILFSKDFPKRVEEIESDEKQVGLSHGEGEVWPQLPCRKRRARDHAI